MSRCSPAPEEGYNALGTVVDPDFADVCNQVPIQSPADAALRIRLAVRYMFYRRGRSAIVIVGKFAGLRWSPKRQIICLIVSRIHASSAPDNGGVAGVGIFRAVRGSPRRVDNSPNILRTRSPMLYFAAAAGSPPALAFNIVRQK